jgi:CHAT domain-containing protein
VILSHGLRDPTDERPSQILLAAPGGGADPLSCDEVEALVSPPVVFLGVCGSARGPAREGTGPAAHLGGAFLLAGADAVVLSDADLSLGPTVLLAEAFLGRLRAGDGPAEAMREARLALLAAGWSDPHDWGSMRVVGLGGG